MVVGDADAPQPLSTVPIAEPQHSGASCHICLSPLAPLLGASLWG